MGTRLGRRRMPPCWRAVVRAGRGAGREGPNGELVHAGGGRVLAGPGSDPCRCPGPHHARLTIRGCRSSFHATSRPTDGGDITNGSSDLHEGEPTSGRARYRDPDHTGADTTAGSEPALRPAGTAGAVQIRGGHGKLPCTSRPPSGPNVFPDPTGRRRATRARMKVEESISSLRRPRPANLLASSRPSPRRGSSSVPSPPSARDVPAGRSGDGNG